VGLEMFIRDRDRPPPKKKKSAHVCYGQTAGWIKMALGMEVGLGPGHIVLDGDLATLPKKGQTPNFLPILLVAKRPDASRCQIGMEVGLNPGDFVLDGDPALSQKGAEPPIFGRHFCGLRPMRHCVRWGDPNPLPKGAQPPNVRCGQTAGWTKMPLGTPVGLGPGDLCSMRTQLPQKKGTPNPSNFWPMSIVIRKGKNIFTLPDCDQTAEWIKVPLGTKVNLGPGNVVLDGGCSCPLKGAQPPVFVSCL